MKLGIALKIDVTKLDKSRFFTGAKGTYADLTVFIDTDKPGQYDDHGGISQSVTKEERANQVKMPFIGSAKVFWEGQSQQNQGYQGNNQQQQQGYQPQNQGYQNAPIDKPQSGYQPQADSQEIPF